jgi:hypothetical protein|tara:strand:+ start:9389 stop:9895 length:507 start_codon:yes stop_codon:yes gene_type:complete
MFMRHAEPQDIFTVAQKMRDKDFNEISSLLYVDDRDELAFNLSNKISNFETVYVVGDTEPVAIVSYIPVRPGVWSLGMFATDKFKSVGLYLTKRIIRDIIPALDRAKAHRVEAFSIDGYDEVHDWLDFLGLQEECTLSKYGKNGEDFKVFSWVRSPDRKLAWCNRRVN